MSQQDQNKKDFTVLEDEKDKLMDHGFDGIHELDNDLPSWWVSLFYICIIWSVAYMGYYHFYQDGSQFQEDQYEQEVAKAQEAYQARLSNLDKLPENERIEFLAGLGSNVFQSNCVICHGDKGQGSVGPNLTDNFAIHAYDEKGLRKVIADGVISRGMPAWKAQLNDVDLKAVSAYVATLVNTNVKGGKTAQGKDLSKGAAAFAKTEEKAPTQEVVKELTADEKAKFMNSKGPELYAAKCLACHGAKGEGLIGPNLTDNFLKHGTTAADMKKVITDGVPATAMVAWKGQLSELEIDTLTQYIWSLKGKNLPGKAPEGKEVK